MTRGTGARSGLAVAVLAGALSIAGLFGAPATAAPAHAAAASREAVVIVHTASRSALHTTIAAAERSGAGLRHTFARPHSFSVQVPEDDLAAETARLSRLPDVTGIEPAVSRHFFTTVDNPDDPGFDRQTAYLDAVHAPAAWAVQHGSSAVTIAVLDTGVDVTQPDLAGKIAGTYNAGTGGTSVTDQIGHGTFVAGVAAASTDNGVGVAGAGWDTDILAVKVASGDGQLPVDDEIAGIRWAVTNGANIINLSLGGPEYSASERSAIDFAISKGVLVVAAAGNTGQTAKQYPAAYPGVVSVGATDPGRNTRADFSTYGSWVTLAAPGVRIYSTTPQAGTADFPGRTGYSTGDGTSFAAPMVAGEAALLEAQDPALGEEGVRDALVASAHGYQKLGLGAGQVDFAAALNRVAPSTRPSDVQAPLLPMTGKVPVSATSSAPEVAFQIDTRPLGKPVRVSGGVASTTLSSYGFPNGPHTVHAYDCSAAGVCSASPTDAGVTFLNSAPTITAPAAGSVASGRFTVTATHGGGGAELLVDGNPYAFAPSSPYTFTVDGTAMSDGSHSLGVELCSDAAQCAGPSSLDQSVDTESLHPKINSLSPATISPNADGVDDSGTLTFTLPDTETVTAQTVDNAGDVVRTVAVGTLDAGTHTWTWDGRGAHGATLSDGRYTLALQTSADDSGTQLLGYASRSAAIDTHAPSLTQLRGGGRTFYPVHDGYRDLFTPSVRLGDVAHVSMVVADDRGHVVRTLHGYRKAGTVSLSWNGRDQHGRRVAAGHYRWWYTATDDVGNTRRTATSRVSVSSLRLVHRTVKLRRAGAADGHAVATRPSCTSAKKKPSSFRHGLLLVNGCRQRTGDLAFASYRFTVPRALSYGRLVLSVYGRTTHRPSQLTAAIGRTDGGLDVRHYAKAKRRGTHWLRIVSVPADDHLTHSRKVNLSIVLTSAFGGRNNFDLKWVRLRVGVTRLG